MPLIGALVRRAVAQRSAFPLAYQARALRSQRLTEDEETVLDAVQGKWRTPKANRVYAGQVVKEKFQRFPERPSRQLAAPPAMIDLIEPEPPNDPEPKPEYTEEEMALFAEVDEIAKEDALQDYRVSQFNADFLDTIGPGIKPVHNVAALANKVNVLQKLIHLGVSMHKWDNKPHITQNIIKLSWRRDCEPRIELLVNRAGVHPENLSRILTKNPLLLCEEFDHLQTRLDFLYAKMSKKLDEGGFEMTTREVSRVVTKEPFWLSYSLERMENRVQFFMKEFQLSKQELKEVAIKSPQVVISDLRRLILNKFSMKEEFGFSFAEMRQILLSTPKVFTKNKNHLLFRFDILHREMGFDHGIIAAFPQVLYTREQRLKDRLGFLKHLDRAQFNSKQPGYVSPLDIAATSDEHFIEKVARSSAEEFENYLKLH